MVIFPKDLANYKAHTPTQLIVLFSVYLPCSLSTAGFLIRPMAYTWLATFLVSSALISFYLSPHTLSDSLCQILIIKFERKNNQLNSFFFKTRPYKSDYQPPCEINMFVTSVHNGPISCSQWGGKLFHLEGKWGLRIAESTLQKNVQTDTVSCA